MSEAVLQLRPATARDAYALWLWANDADTRAASFGRGAIPWPRHVAWLARQLEDDGAMVLLAESRDGQPLGSVRFDTTDAWITVRLSYVVAPESRGQALSAPLIRGGVERLRATHARGAPARSAVRADVTSTNARSLRVFRGLGWAEEPSEAGIITFWFR